MQQIARRAMVERGLLPDFSPAALAELNQIQGLPADSDPARDLRALLWCSIDNDASRDLDQLTVAEALPGGAVKLLVADVAALVHQDSPLDRHARANTTSVYTVAEIFPMLPEKLSTDLTSLNDGAERSAVVVEMVVAPDGSTEKSDLYIAKVRNRAKLAYQSVAAWLEGAGPVPPGVSALPGLAENLRLQEEAAGRMQRRRQECGALTLETAETRLTFDDGKLKDLEAEKRTARRRTASTDFENRQGKVR